MKHNKKTRAWLLSLAALVLLICNVYVGRAQTNPLGDNNFIVWYHDWFQDYDLGEIVKCQFNSEENILAVESYKNISMDTNIYFISFFDVNSGEFLDNIIIKDKIICGGFVFFNDSTILIGENTILFYDVSSKQVVRKIDYLKKNYPTRVIDDLSISRDKRYLAVSTVQDFFVFDLLTDSVLMKRSIPDMDFFKNPYYNSYLSCRFIEKTNSLLVVNGSQLLEFDYKKDTLLSSSALGPKPSNLDVSDSEDMLTYAAWSENLSNNAYIFDMKTKKFERFQAGDLKVYMSYFVLGDKYLHLARPYDLLTTQLYNINEKRAFFCDIPKSIFVMRAKLGNRFILYNDNIMLIDGDAFITDVPQDDTKAEVLIHPNPGTNLVNIDVNLSSMGFYKLNISNVEGNIVKSQDYGYLESGKNQLTLNISDLLPGIYFLNLTNGSHNYNFKLVKE